MTETIVKQLHAQLTQVRTVIARQSRVASLLEQAIHEAQPRNGKRPRRALRAVRKMGGPRETLVALVQRHPGIQVEALLDQAVKLVKTKAKDPRRNLTETLRALRKAKKITRDESGGHHA